MTYYEKTILIIGGGLAGLTAALDLRQAGYAVTVLEKGELPRHKVCGEYISNEVLPYLQRLGVDPFAFGATRMERMELSTEQGKRVSSPLPLGGFGISRHCLDGQLKTQLLQAGGLVIQDEVRRIERAGEVFTLTTQSGETHQATV
ncbi:MAG: FAD-dependent oxidoreductase, partial [Bacteroidota bacterium]